MSAIVIQQPIVFPYQSYFDSTLLQNAIVQSQTNTPYAGSPTTKQDASGEFYGFAVHPSSDTPVTIRTYTGGGASAPIILTPGQSIMFPESTRIEYGLPFGWLGGGSTLIYLLKDPAAIVNFGPGVSSRMLFQRSRYIVETGAVSGLTLRPNWPGTIPWQSAIAGANLMPLAAGPLLQLEPDICLMRCRFPFPASTGPLNLTFVWRGVDDFDTAGNGTIGTTDQTSYDLTFPNSPDGVMLPLNFLPIDVHKMTCSIGGLNIIDNNAGTPIALSANPYVDILRYVRVD